MAGAKRKIEEGKIVRRSRSEGKDRKIVKRGNTSEREAEQGGVQARERKRVNEEKTPRLATSQV